MTGPRIVGPHDGKFVNLTTIGVRFMIGGPDSGGTFALVEHPIPPRTLAAPLHRHAHEDEYSYVLEGRMGAQLGDDVVHASVGDLVFKPRGQWHTFWNASDEPCRILEIISPAGFERYFEDLAALVPVLRSGDPTAGMRALEICTRYGLEVQPDSIPQLCRAHGLRLPGPPEE